MGINFCCPSPINNKISNDELSGESFLQEIIRSTMIKDILFESIFKILTEKDYGNCIANLIINEDLFMNRDQYNEVTKTYFFKKSLMKNQYALIHLLIFSSLGISCSNEESLVDLKMILCVFLSFSKEFISI